jgi:CO/xanthine dehydrogenase Mo-binding subunit
MTAPLRSPMDRGPAFSTEQIVDELAYAIRSDPLEFRRRNMTGNDAWLRVLDAVAKAANWHPGPAAAKLSDAKVVTGRGFGFGTHAYGGGLQAGLDFRTLDPTTPAAAIADIEVNKKTGKIRATHIYNATDAGLAVNPAGIENQMSGGSIFGLSRILEQVNFNKSRVTSLDWVTYPILRFKDAPLVTNVLVSRPDQLPLGSGEPTVVPVPGAVANAFFDATGVRIRTGPFTPAVVRATLRAAGVA